MSNLSWCDLNIKGNLLKLQDMCPNPKCECQKLLTFTLNQFQGEGAGFEVAMGKIFQGIEKVLNSFLKPAANTLAPVIGIAV